MTAGLRRLTPEDLPHLRRFWQARWGNDEIIVHGEVYRPEAMEGFIVDDWSGVLTYVIEHGDCEIITIDSLVENQGKGTALIDAVIRQARECHCRRVFLSTTNDNLRALGFYQRRGFELASLRRAAINETRKRKPGIPLVAGNGIPIRDEIELEMRL